MKAKSLSRVLEAVGADGVGLGEGIPVLEGAAEAGVGGEVFVEDGGDMSAPA